MTQPPDIGQQYDAIAEWWQNYHQDSDYGVAALERALGFAGLGRRALDVGCGAGGRLIRRLEARGFDVTGVDASAKMIELARGQHPNGRFVQADMNIPPAKKAPLMLCGKVLDPRLETYAAQLSPMARVERVELADDVPNNALQTVVDGVQYAIPLAGLVDLDEKRKRLGREIAKAQAGIDKIDKKLGNEAFVAKAPEKVVNLQKERRAGYAAEVELLQTALDGLG